jgi:hypothetical protein
VLVGGVVRNEVEPDVDVVVSCLGYECVVVGERAEVGVDIAVVGDVVAPIDVRARMNRAEPEGVDPK